MTYQNKTQEGESELSNVFEFKKAQKQVRKKGNVLSFFQLIEKNKENQERLQKERKQANLSVIRSHRLKK